MVVGAAVLREGQAMSYAENTTVPVSKTRGEIEALVEKHGATEFSSGWMGSVAGLQFQIKGRRVRFQLGTADHEWAKDRIMKAKRSRYYYRNSIPDAEAAKVADAENRRRWRCLLLAIKAKLEVVETGIATFDEEFLAHIVVGDGQQTVYDFITQQVANGLPLLGPVEP
jgi:hypothetical protein